MWVAHAWAPRLCRGERGEADIPSTRRVASSAVDAILRTERLWLRPWTLDDAEAWLVASPLGSKPSKGDKSAGADLESLLDQYNNGLQGPPHCD